MIPILLVVHRYKPFPGGSEEYVGWIAEELVARGFDVTVLANEHMGDINGVKVTNDHKVLLLPKWALIIVHGGGCVSQDIVHANAKVIPSPVLYLIIKPSHIQNCIYGLMQHRFLGYSTGEDFDYIQEYGLTDKARRVTHGIDLASSVGRRERQDTDPHYFMSAGGFWPHKGFDTLAHVFSKSRPNDQLFLYGYSNDPAPEGIEGVTCIRGAPRQEVIDALGCADAYVMNSTEEGFGLVLLEAAINKVPWIARDIAGASVLADFGTLYKTEDELAKILTTFDVNDPIIKKKVARGFDHVTRWHLIKNTCDDIRAILIEMKVVKDGP